MIYYPRRYLLRIYFSVDNAKSGKTYCEVCFKILLKGEIRIKHEKNIVKSDYFHLHCYDHKSKQFILIENITIDLTDESKVIFYDWLAAWNANFFPLDRSLYSPVLPNQQKFDIQVKKRRILLEIFKFLDIFDLVRSISKVSKSFNMLTWEKELWGFLLIRDFKISNTGQTGTELKKNYVSCFFSTCFECRKIPSDQSFSRCPLIKKTLCLVCLKLDKFTLINKTQILKAYGVNSDLIQVSWWTYDGHCNVTYRILFENALFRFRNERKAKVLEFLKNFCTNLEVFRCFERLDVTTMDLKVMDNTFCDLELWKPDYQKVVKGRLYEKLFDFVRKGKELDFNKLIGNKQLKG